MFLTDQHRRAIAAALDLTASIMDALGENNPDELRELRTVMLAGITETAR